MATPLTSAELADLRRFCGYPLAGIPLPPEYAPGADLLAAIISALDGDGIDTLRRVYLVPLSAMESGIFGAADGLDIKKAAVYERNLNELAERDALFTAWRYRLCAFLGVPPGPGAVPSPGLGGSAAYTPAIYAV